MAGGYVEAPDELPADAGPSVFLAGGISGCPDWQQDLRALLEDELVVVNPRRPTFDVDDPEAAPRQIEWEHRHLRRVDVVSFWFCAATLCPIVLYELGAWSMTDKPLAVGVEPGYARKLDVCVQTELARPEVWVVDSLEALAEEVRRLGLSVVK